MKRANMNARYRQLKVTKRWSIAIGPVSGLTGDNKMRYLTRSQAHSSILSFAGIAALAVITGCSTNNRPAEDPSFFSQDVEKKNQDDEAAMQPASRELAPGETAASARGPSSQGAEQVAPVASEPPPEPLDDAKIAAIADAANAGEVEQAKVALTKAKNARVRKFAQMMIQHHGQAKKDGEKLAKKLSLTPVESSTSGMLRQESATLVSTLQSETSNFDEVYINGQVDGHQKVLDLFDKRLIQSASAPELKAELEKFRPKIEAHLTEAREIQKVLATSAGANRAGATQQSDVAGKQQPGATPDQGTRAGQSHDQSPKSGAAQ
jgi:putative membrane protein